MQAAGSPVNNQEVLTDLVNAMHPVESTPTLRRRMGVVTALTGSPVNSVTIQLGGSGVNITGS